MRLIAYFSFFSFILFIPLEGIERQKKFMVSLTVPVRDYVFITGDLSNGATFSSKGLRWIKSPDNFKKLLFSALVSISLNFLMIQGQVMGQDGKIILPCVRQLPLY